MLFFLPFLVSHALTFFHIAHNKAVYSVSGGIESDGMGGSETLVSEDRGLNTASHCAILQITRHLSWHFFSSSCLCTLGLPP